MLQLVRNRDDRSDGDEPSLWPDALDGYRDRAAPVRARGHQRRGRRRSVAGRVGLTALIAVAAVSFAASVYFAARSGVFDDVLAPDAEPASLATTSAASPAAQVQPAEQAVVQSAVVTPQPPVPDVAGLVVLIRNAIMALHQANATGNYSVLRDVAAPGFQLANNPASLSDAFADLRNREVNLEQIAAVNPRLHRDPAIDDQGLLRLVGFFPAGPVEVDFDLAFQPLDSGWRLFGIGVQPRPESAAGNETAPPAVDAGTIPDAVTIVALIRGSVLALSQANTTGNYSVIHDMASPGFRAANNVARLTEIFSDLRGRGLDLAPVAVIDPALFRPPAIDRQGYLRLTGYFPSRPEQVNFDLAFQFADGGWKLFGIGVNTSREVPPESPEAASTVKDQTSLDEPIAPALGGGAATVPMPRLRPQP